MEKDSIIEILEQLLKNNSSLTDIERKAIIKAITLIKKSNSKEQILKAIDILIKLLGIGSNFF